MNGRRSFGPLVLVGLGSAGLLALAGSRAWATFEGSGDAGEGHAGSAFASALLVDGAGEMPLAGALGLVVLACWGALLVTRGRVRRGVAILAAVAAAGAIATVVVGGRTLPDDLRTDLTGLAEEVDVHLTAWFWAALLAALVALAASVLAVRLAPQWPEMGSRYDAPTGASAAAPAKPVAEQSSLDLWKRLDEGDDPTA